ncbi:MAG: hypothetical protein HQK99_02550 [Nitrospirae bacterium]|nr:hypothetical protein [Nitrospirota bacterium]
MSSGLTRFFLFWYCKDMVKSLDTLNIFERLRTAELSDRAAKEIAEVLREVIEDRLATKTDLEITKSALELKMESLELKMESVKSELKADIERSGKDSIKWMLAFCEVSWKKWTPK